MNVNSNMEDQINKRDLIIATIIAIVLGVTFWNLSSGLSLKVTFIPGLVLTYSAFAWMFVTKAKLPSGSDFLPAFFLLLAVQFIHFAEEFTTGFAVRFPALYGGEPYSESLFVTFNMASYSVFSVGCILALTRKLRFLLMPALFFIIYGALGSRLDQRENEMCNFRCTQPYEDKPSELKKKLRGFRENRMAVRFEYEWHDQSGQWLRSYGNELWQFTEDGLMSHRYASINDLPIEEEERYLTKNPPEAARS